MLMSDLVIEPKPHSGRSCPGYRHWHRIGENLPCGILGKRKNAGIIRSLVHATILPGPAPPPYPTLDRVSEAKEKIRELYVRYGVAKHALALIDQRIPERREMANKFDLVISHTMPATVRPQ